MSAVVDALDRASPAHGNARRWADEVQRSLRDDPGAWLEAAGRGELSRGRSRVLLGWVERSASSVVVSRSAELVEAGAFAMSLLEDGALDTRDVMVVASLVRRAADLAGLDFAGSVRAGCERAGDRGARCLEWLRRVSERTPPTHIEVGSGAHFRFQRVPSEIDTERLMRWAKGEDRPGSGGAVVDRDRGVGRGRSAAGADDPRSVGSRPESEVRPWPKPVRYVLLLGLVALVGVGLVILLYSAGVVPIVGPFVAMIVGPLLVLLGRLWQGRRVTRHSSTASTATSTC
ncbi:MAG: hypothetical protein GEV10_04210 [Streptosporangiales bacterium]|nr:hypothetical protein [Streptosporangiales bacterium]